MSRAGTADGGTGSGAAVLVHDAPLSGGDGTVVRTVSINRPERRNALDAEDRIALIDALRRAEEDPAVRAVVLTGEGMIFSAGGDIRSMTADPEIAASRLDLAGDLARSLVGCRTPLVAAVEGGAYGLGLAVAAACDLVVAGEGASFVAAFGRIGLAPDTGLSWSLTQRVGPARAREMILTTRPMDAREALATGLVSRLVPDGTAREAAGELAADLAMIAPLAYAEAKATLTQPDQGFEAILEAEKQAQLRLFRTADFAEGQAAFLARRPARFTGH